MCHHKACEWSLVASAFSEVVAAHHVQAFSLPAPPVIQAKSAILVDADNDKSSTKKMPISVGPRHRPPS